MLKLNALLSDLKEGLKILTSTITNYMNYVDGQIVKLLYCERVSREARAEKKRSLVWTGAAAAARGNNKESYFENTVQL